MKLKMNKEDWLTKDGEIVIKDGIALRDIKENEELVSYGKVMDKIRAVILEEREEKQEKMN